MNRKQKYRKTLEAQQPESKSNDSELINESSVRASRQSSDMRNFTLACFFCGSHDKSDNLHQCETLAVHRRVERYAEELEDTAVLAKLSEGDMIATEAKYHVKCLVGFYNKHRALSNAPSNTVHSEDDIMKGNFSNFML